MKSFITGSHAYGTPTENSDVDLAIFCSEEDADFLWKASEDGPSVRFGKMNLIIFTNERAYDRWKECTNNLISRRPVTRDEAIAEFQRVGFDDYPTHMMTDKHLDNEKPNSSE
jgi:hypothetical protein